MLGKEKYQTEYDRYDNKELHSHDEFMAFLTDGIGKQIERLRVAAYAQGAHHTGRAQTFESHDRKREQPLQIERQRGHYVKKAIK